MWPSAPEAPHVSSVDYSRGVLFVRWTYGELFIDLSHSRILHWQVLAIGKKGPESGFSVDVSPSVCLGSAHTGRLLIEVTLERLFGVIGDLLWQVTRNVMRASLPLPPGDIYNVTVTACTERSRNTSAPTIIKLGGL